MNRDVLDDALGQLIETALEIQVGMSDVPTQTPTLPYIILAQSSSPGPDGSYADPEDMPGFDYLLKSVGRDHRETARTASRMRGVVIGRIGGQWAYPLLADGFEIVNRRIVTAGGIFKAAGPDLFEVNDIYRISITSLVG